MPFGVTIAVKMAIHLHTHSYYSFLEGLASPGELAQAASDLGMPALALTDFRTLTGAVEFYDACETLGVNPILGLELAVEAPGEPPFVSSKPHSGNLVFLAMDGNGWRSLCRLSSLCCSGDNGGAGALSLEELIQEARGLICLTGGLRGLLAGLVQRHQLQFAFAWLERLGEIFPAGLYVELQNHTSADINLCHELASLASQLNLPIVATHNVHYLVSEQAGLQRLATAIRLGQTLEQVPLGAFAQSEAYFIKQSEMKARFAEYPQALAATYEIAERCKMQLPLGKPLFPNAIVSAPQTDLEVLGQKARAGALHLYGDISPAIQERLDHELSVIGDHGYASIFLVMEEILTYARQRGIPTASRGSASSSLVAHCLGITSPDPLRLNLYFERFLNPARTTPPDIDVDLCSRRRDEVIDFVYRRFGQDHVAMVCTINRFRRRSALRETAKAYGLSAKQISALAERLPPRWHGPLRKRNEGVSPYAELEARYTSPTHQSIFRGAADLIGHPHHLSIHPGGVVISPQPITDIAPTQLAAKGLVITQFDLESIERLGLIKIDLLGIRGLSVLGDVAEHALSEQDKRLEETNQESKSSVNRGRELEFLEAIPDEDPATSETIHQAHTIGCFQIESPGMRATLREVQANNIDDILVALALYRPGPLTGGLKDAFVRRHIGQEEPSQLHPALTPLLSDTYGVILYQEQVLRIAHELAGLSLADADLLRRAMSHFDPGEQMQTLKEKFVIGVQKRHQIPESTSERIWELMAAFAGYGFPKAHAASYAQVAWRAAWCKTHHPAIFMAAVLANWGGYYSQRIYLSEARRMGLEIRPPHMNYALRQFSVRYLQGKPVLFMGLDQVRDLTRRTQARILRERPFHSLADFLARVDPRPVEAENLIRCGALTGFGAIPSLLQYVQTGTWRGGQLSLFQQVVEADEDWDQKEKILAQESVLGVSVDAHPLELVADQIAASGALSTLEAAASLNQHLRVAGMRQTWRRRADARGEYVYFMTLEDLEGTLDVVITAQIYRQYRSALTVPGPYLVEGVIELRQGESEPFLRAERLDLLRSG